MDSWGVVCMSPFLPGTVRLPWCLWPFLPSRAPLALSLRICPLPSGSEDLPVPPLLTCLPVRRPASDLSHLLVVLPSWATPPLCTPFPSQCVPVRKPCSHSRPPVTSLVPVLCPSPSPPQQPGTRVMTSSWGTWADLQPPWPASGSQCVPTGHRVRGTQCGLIRLTQMQQTNSITGTGRSQRSKIMRR